MLGACAWLQRVVPCGAGAGAPCGPAAWPAPLCTPRPTRARRRRSTTTRASAWRRRTAPGERAALVSCNAPLPLTCSAGLRALSLRHSHAQTRTLALTPRCFPRPTRTDWVNYTALPLPTKRRMLAVADEPGGCQLAEVYQRREEGNWNYLSTLAFQISHLDKQGR